MLTWKVKTNDKTVFLTFDDGPHPDITPWVLDTLKQFNAHATFFCVGENVDRYPETYTRVLREGHAVGNHTYNHLNGWKTSLHQYLLNTDACAGKVDSRLFRPPYGRIGFRQLRALRSKGYQIIMWDILTRDYDQHTDIPAALKAILQHTSKGSIVVFHDSLKAAPQLKQLLPRVLETLQNRGYQFLPLTT